MERDSANWRKSTHSSANGGQCVEAGNCGRAIVVRDTADRAGVVLTVPARAWRALLTEALLTKALLTEARLTEVRATR